MAIVYVNYAFMAYVMTTDDLNWATVRAYSGEHPSLSTGIGQANSEASNPSTGRYRIKRAFLTFNTNGALPANYTISAVALNINWNNGFGNQGYYIVPNVMASPTAISKSDYARLTGSAYSAKFSGLGLLNVALTGLTVNNSGYTKIGIIHYYDYENTTPSSSHGYAGTPSSVNLQITYTTPPIVTSANYAQNINVNSALLLGEVTDVGGGTVTERGVCWSTSINPTTSSSKATSAGGLGQFQVDATGLYPGTLYHYRAFVTTENSTTYGADKTFTTYGGASGILMM